VQVKIVINPDNTVLLSVLDGSYEQARPQLQSLLDQLGADGFTLVPETPIEQHRHSPTEAQVHAHDHA
jgi:hypothetical protein